MREDDGLLRIKEGIRAFYELNNLMPKALKIPITCGVISVKALEIRDKLISSHEQCPFLKDTEMKEMKRFAASQSWSSKMALQNGWRSKVLHGEAGGVDKDAIAGEISDLRKLVAEYDPENVYNMDETGLFFKCLPNRSYVDEENIKEARGTKLMKAKDRVTVYVTTNATGNDLVPLSMIGKSKKPRCFRNRTLKVRYYNQNKAWSDTKTFSKWWEHFCNYIRTKTNAKVLLIMDNCGPHGKELIDPLGQITVVFLPPNCTSVYQPMDCGVIAMLKKNYRYRLLRKMLEMFEDREALREAAKEAKMTAGTMGLDEGFAPHLRDVMEILYEVWSDVKPSAVKNCWRKSTLIFGENAVQGGEATQEEGDGDSPVQDEGVDAATQEEGEGNTEDAPMVGGSEDEEDDAEDKETREIIAIVATFAKENSCKSDHSKPRNDFEKPRNDFDEVLYEMA